MCFKQEHQSVRTISIPSQSKVYEAFLHNIYTLTVLFPNLQLHIITRIHNVVRFTKTILMCGKLRHTFSDIGSINQLASYVLQLKRVCTIVLVLPIVRLLLNLSRPMQLDIQILGVVLLVCKLVAIACSTHKHIRYTKLINLINLALESMHVSSYYLFTVGQRVKIYHLDKLRRLWPSTNHQLFVLCYLTILLRSRFNMTTKWYSLAMHIWVQELYSYIISNDKHISILYK